MKLNLTPMNAVKERPILMSGEMVRAILEGRKTMTRRVIKPQPESIGLGRYDMWDWDRKEGSGIFLKDWSNNQHILPECPYGQIGDMLWVKETYQWVTLAEKDHWKDKSIADGTFRRMPDGSPVKMCFESDGYEIGAPWKSSLFMPRWASRINLETAEIRVERLQDISEEDAQAEGVNGGCLSCGQMQPCGCSNPDPSYIDSFVFLWNSINVKNDCNWSENPWVWVIEWPPK